MYEESQTASMVPGGNTWIEKITTNAADTVGSIQVHFSGVTSNTAYVGIYADNADAPGTLLASSAETAISDGWNSINFSATVALSDATVYWVAIAADSPSVFHNGTFNNLAEVVMTGAYGALASDPSVSPSGNTDSFAIRLGSTCTGSTPSPTGTDTPIPTPNATQTANAAATQTSVVLSYTPTPNMTETVVAWLTANAAATQTSVVLSYTPTETPTPNATQTANAAATQTSVVLSYTPTPNATQTANAAATQTSVALSYTPTPNMTQTVGAAQTQTANAAATQTSVVLSYTSTPNATQTAAAAGTPTAAPTATPPPDQPPSEPEALNQSRATVRPGGDVEFSGGDSNDPFVYSRYIVTDAVGGPEIAAGSGNVDGSFEVTFPEDTAPGVYIITVEFRTASGRVGTAIGTVVVRGRAGR